MQLLSAHGCLYYTSLRQDEVRIELLSILYKLQQRDVVGTWESFLSRMLCGLLCSPSYHSKYYSSGAGRRNVSKYDDIFLCWIM